MAGTLSLEDKIEYLREAGAPEEHLAKDQHQFIDAADDATIYDMATKYAKASGAIADEPRLMEQALPDVGGFRFKLKNFGVDESDPKSLEIAQKQVPGMEWKHEKGRLWGRRPGELDYSALDPSGGFEWQDISDVASDVGEGALQGLAAIPGIAATLPAAGLGGAAVAGLTGAGLDLLRQQIGKGLGVREDTDFGQAALSGAVSAAVPVVGAGLRKILTSKPVVNAVAHSNNVPVRPLRRAVDSSAFHRASQYLGSEAGAEDLAKQLEGVSRGIKETAQNRVTTAGKMLGSINKASDDILKKVFNSDGIDIKSLNQLVRSSLAKVEARAAKLGSPEAINGAAKLRNFIESRLVDAKTGEYPRIMNLSTLHDLKQVFADSADFDALVGNLPNELARDVSSLSRGVVGEIDKMTNNTVRMIEQTLNNLTSNNPKAATSALRSIKSKYKNELIRRKRLTQAFGTPEKVEANLPGLSDNPKKVTLRTTLKKVLSPKQLEQLPYTEDMLTEISKVEHGKFKPNYWRAVSIPGATGGIGFMLGGPIGAAIGSGIGFGADRLISNPRTYLKAVRAMDSFGPEAKNTLRQLLLQRGLPLTGKKMGDKD